MKYKQFKKEINYDTNLLKLSSKDLAAIFGIDVLKAKYFKKKYKQELQCAVEFDINDTNWYDTLTNQSVTYKGNDYDIDNMNSTLNVDFSELKKVFEDLENKHLKKEYTKSDIIEVECTCPFCKEDIIIESFNSGKNIVECPSCYTLLTYEDGVVSKSNVKYPKRSDREVLDYLLTEIEKLKK